MNPDHPRYNPLLAAAVTAWEAFETEEAQNEYRNKNSRKSIEAWLENNAGKIPKLFQKIGVVSNISKNAAEKISEVANWNKIGAQKKAGDS
jgi:LmbE family N-acetylglucosaminyl deacetylase